MIDRLPNDTILRGAKGEYRIVSVIGRGGMGIVYRAKRLADDSTWALKEMRPGLDIEATEIAENRKLFEQEASILQDLDHPNIVTVSDSFEHEGRPCMVMEFVPGQTLEQRLREANAPLLEQVVLPWGIQICRVLTYLHTLTPPIIYRDLKPANVIVRPDGLLKLLDFGVARTYKKDKLGDTFNIGTAGFAPPEQYGKEQTTARSDIYALGATLLYLLTNLAPVPMQPPKPGEITARNPSVDAQTEQLIITSMALKPGERYTSAAAMEQALHQRLDTPYADPVARLAPVPVPAPAPAPVPAPRAAAPQGAGQAQATAPTQQPQAATNDQATTEAPVPPAILRLGGVACLNCGRVNKAGARFCAGCGTPLRDLPNVRLLISSPRGRWEHRIERMPCLIGRRDPRQNHYPQIDLAEHDKGIASRNHARIDRNGEAYVLTDLGSTNGTIVNGKPLPAQQPYALKQGDRIRIGEVELEFRYA